MTFLSRRHSVEGLRARLVAGLVSGAPSTVYSVAAGRDPLEATLAAGSMILPHEHRRGRLVAAAVPVHFLLSALWGEVLAALLPQSGLSCPERQRDNRHFRSHPRRSIVPSNQSLARSTTIRRSHRLRDSGRDLAARL